MRSQGRTEMYCGNKFSTRDMCYMVNLLNAQNLMLRIETISSEHVQFHTLEGNSQNTE